MKPKRDFITQNLREQIGGGESARMYVITTVHSGETEVVVEKTISERFPVQEIEKAEDLYERLICGDGRKVFKLEEIAHPYNPNSRTL